VKKNAGETGADFRNWVRTWGPGLWNLLARDGDNEDSLLEDFFEIAERVRSVKAPAGAAGDVNRSQAFVKEWLRRAKTRTERSQLEDRLFLTGHLLLGWSAEELSVILGGLSPQAFRRRLFEALKRSAELGLSDTRYLGRDCARQDLFLVDSLLGLTWKDPLAFFDPATLEAHREGCPRCRSLYARLGEEIRRTRGRSVTLPPASYLEQLDSLGLFREDWKPNRWIRAWPWYLRLPLQLGLASLVVFAVLAVPYYGDLFPELRRSMRARRDKPAPTPTAVASAAPSPTPSFRPLVLAPEAEQSVPDVVPSPVPTVAKATPPLPTVAPTVAAAALPSVTPTPVAGVWNERKFYQWGAFTPDLEGQTQAVLALLKGVNAEQSGELKLGAPNRGGRYFHFSIAAGDYEKLKEGMRGLGLREFTEEAAQSWRRTPTDKRRIVFLLKPSP
jgi:hypothetical protein